MRVKVETRRIITMDELGGANLSRTNDRQQLCALSRNIHNVPAYDTSQLHCMIGIRAEDVERNMIDLPVGCC